MIVSYNGTALDDNQVEWSESTSYNRDERKNRRSMTRKVMLKGFVKGSTEAELKSKINALYSLFAADGGDLVLYHNGGAVTSAHQMLNATSLTGVMVVSGPDFANGSGVEYATERTYTVSLEAEYPIANSDNFLAFTEQVRIVGTGGPRRAGIELITGNPQIQIVNQKTLMYATQSGSAMGWSSEPPFPGPIPVLAPYENVDKRSYTPISPKWKGNAFREFGVSWSYEFMGVNLPLVLPTYA